MSGTKRAAWGCLFGLALGDALAAPTEFIRGVDEIEQRWGKGGPAEPEGDPALVTDDTQMTLAVGEALAQAQRPYTAGAVEGPLTQAFVAWMVSPDNTRAPGRTCMLACRCLAQGQRWVRATLLNSKGCGANMRVAPVGLLPDLEPATRAALAQFQAAITHGHPTALAASDLTAQAIALLSAGCDLSYLPSTLREYARSQESLYHEDWLENLWDHCHAASPRLYISEGWRECLAILDRLDTVLDHPDRTADPCIATGAGWIAEEAFATGLLCFLLFPDDPVAALRRAAVTSGDSDSIACLTGAFAGAYHGWSAWPEGWVRRIEYRDRLSALAALWDNSHQDSDGVYATTMSL